ncbi:MAG: pyridoxamine 5'-phosphate oxidase [Candidatus Eisenbacteria bacterium]|nr:pyridoxamine 5'-phosphate oxidase [Candidatus Eisenbacteria bacterium]
MHRDPFEKFGEWLKEARRTHRREPTACSLATVDPDGAPSNRMVLLKGFDERGFVFYTNLESRKCLGLPRDPRASLCFFWLPWLVLGIPVYRQVRIEGPLALVSGAEADAYFATRPRGSQIGAWASPQSRVIPGRRELEAQVKEFERRFAGQQVPRPPYWSGYRLEPARIEFWTSRISRLHDRELYVRDGDGWRVEILAP